MLSALWGLLLQCRGGRHHHAHFTDENTQACEAERSASRHTAMGTGLARRSRQLVCLFQDPVQVPCDTHLLSPQYPLVWATSHPSSDVQLGGPCVKGHLRGSPKEGDPRAAYAGRPVLHRRGGIPPEEHLLPSLRGFWAHSRTISLPLKGQNE